MSGCVAYRTCWVTWPAPAAATLSPQLRDVFLGIIAIALPRLSYIPNQYISIDESMISFKGRLSFLQYLPKKPHKWGMKAWVLADAQTGYTWAWKLYTGKEGDRREKGLAHGVVMELVEDERLQGNGYVVVTDNFYSSPALFRELKQRGFGACGTTRRDRRGIPPTVRDAKLQRGDVISSRDDGILSLKWKDKRDVTMLSTYHDDSMVTKNRRSQAAQGGVEDILKPKVVEDYNKNMGGVDKSKWLLQFLHDTLIVFWKSFGSIVVYSHVPASGFHCHSTCILFTGDQLILYYGFSHRSVNGGRTPTHAQSLPIMLQIMPMLIAIVLEIMPA